MCEETAKHMEAHSEVKMEDIAEAIGKVGSIDSFFMESVELDHIVGRNACVEVTGEDEVVLLYRKGRDGKTPFVKGREAEDTDLVTIGICRDREDGKLTLFTAFYGPKAPKEPWDSHLRPDEREESEAFWSSHALIYDEAAIDPERN